MVFRQVMAMVGSHPLSLVVALDYDDNAVAIQTSQSLSLPAAEVRPQHGMSESSVRERCASRFRDISLIRDVWPCHS